MADIVVGSGPAGVAAARARLDLGQQVILLDGGKILEPEKAALRDALANGKTGGRAAYMSAQSGAEPGQVRRFGSDFAMEPEGASFAEPGAVAVRASRAVGGLSNLWGTAVLPFADKDMLNWPVGAQDIRPHLRSVQSLLPISGRRDALMKDFPDGLPDDPEPVPPTDQAASILRRLDRAAATLEKRGITAGMARQAVAAGCRECGLCLNGCPWGLMWSAAHALPELTATGRLDHRPGAAVHSVSQDATSVTCHLEDGSTVTGDRLFLAAGVLETARILMQSGVAQTLTLREARHAFLPSLLLRRNPALPDREPLTTLPQIFMELDDPSVSPHYVHGQLYGWNEQYAQDLLRSYGRRLKGFGPLWPVLARRLIVAQLFLHSDHWPGIQLNLAAGGLMSATVTGKATASQVMPMAAKAMARGMWSGGMMALTPALRLAGPGSSFHLGASLPMAAEAGRGQTDTLGRPEGQGLVHVVDATVLPAVPATTITFPVMGNAHRIAAQAPT